MNGIYTRLVTCSKGLKLPFAVTGHICFILRNQLKRYSVILTIAFYDMNQKISTEKDCLIRPAEDAVGTAKTFPVSKNFGSSVELWKKKKIYATTYEFT